MLKKWSIYFLLFVLFISSCSKNISSESQPTFFDIQGENGFVGEVVGTNAFVAILAGESEAVAYVCNGDEQISEWFKGAIGEPTRFTLINNDGAKILANFADGSFSGDVTLSNGTAHAFTATPESADNAGIYRVMGEEATADKIDAGWIRDYDGKEKGSLRVDSQSQQTPALPESDVVVQKKSYSVFHCEIRTTPATPPGVPIPYPNIER